MSKLGIVNKIVTFLKLGEEGKLGAFFEKQVRDQERAIKGLEKNIDNIKFNLDRDIDALQEQEEDANAALESAYLDVDVKKIESNADQTAYSEIYWKRITECEIKRNSIEEKMKQIREEAEKRIENLNEQIGERRHRIEQISKA